MYDIKIILMDVDGVLTDGSIKLGVQEELKSFDVKDGMGIALARKAGLKVGFITGRFSISVDRRADELNIEYLYQGCKNKSKALAEILEKEGLEVRNVCYIGDDLPDLPLLKKVGFSATVSDAPDYIKKEVDYVSSKPGGKGAVRDIIEYIMKSTETLAPAIEGMSDE